VVVRVEQALMPPGKGRRLGHDLVGQQVGVQCQCDSQACGGRGRGKDDRLFFVKKK
jgi:hypothetical protein